MPFQLSSYQNISSGVQFILFHFTKKKCTKQICVFPKGL